jgi:5-carboxymethyl-2-hydroxymuconate isomerase
MPHFIIEYARKMEHELSIAEVMGVVFSAGARSGVMQPVNIKVRAMPFDHVRLEGGLTTFVHVTAFLLAGRTPAQKEYLADLIRHDLAQGFSSVESISVDIRDMDPAIYKKRLLKHPVEHAH